MAQTDTSIAAAMRRALTLGARGHGRVSPNPAVGCVILDADGRTVGQGWHQRAGGPHAEVAALQDARDRARGGTAVVTLEPCRHTGHTPACTRALQDAGVRAVRYATGDPLHGGGAQELRQAGLDVQHLPEFSADAARMNRAWLTSVRLGRPHVRWKFAATLDGRSAAADGTSRWITGQAARADVHHLRDTVDAVLIGAGTQRTDDPQLTVRPAPADGRQPLRVVLDPSGSTPPEARVLDAAAPALLLQDPNTAASAAYPSHVQVDEVPRGDLDGALAVLHRRGVRSVLLEGGPRLAGQFVAAGLVDEVIAYLAPALLGAGPAALADSGVSTITGTHRLELTEVHCLGEDLRLTARPRPRHNDPNHPGRRESDPNHPDQRHSDLAATPH